MASLHSGRQTGARSSSIAIYGGPHLSGVPAALGSAIAHLIKLRDEGAVAEAVRPLGLVE